METRNTKGASSMDINNAIRKICKTNDFLNAPNITSQSIKCTFTSGKTLIVNATEDFVTVICVYRGDDFIGSFNTVTAAIKFARE